MSLVNNTTVYSNFNWQAQIIACSFNKKNQNDSPVMIDWFDLNTENFQLQKTMYYQQPVTIQNTFIFLNVMLLRIWGGINDQK